MGFLIIGVLLLLLKYLEFGVVATWSWFVVLSPFALAVAWWTWADWSGYTKRRQAEKIEARKRERLARQRESLGLGTDPRKKGK